MQWKKKQLNVIYEGMIWNFPVSTHYKNESFFFWQMEKNEEIFTTKKVEIKDKILPFF